MMTSGQAFLIMLLIVGLIFVAVYVATSEIKNEQKEKDWCRMYAIKCNDNSCTSYDYKPVINRLYNESYKYFNQNEKSIYIDPEGKWKFAELDENGTAKTVGCLFDGRYEIDYDDEPNNQISIPFKISMVINIAEHDSWLKSIEE